MDFLRVPVRQFDGINYSLYGREGYDSSELENPGGQDDTEDGRGMKTPYTTISRSLLPFLRRRQHHIHRHTQTRFDILSRVLWPRIHVHRSPIDLLTKLHRDLHLARQVDPPEREGDCKRAEANAPRLSRSIGQTPLPASSSRHFIRQ